MSVFDQLEDLESQAAEMRADMARDDAAADDSAPPTSTFTCTGCGAKRDVLEQFPGQVCPRCWSTSEEGQRMPTAQELVAMWGGPVRRKGTR